MENSKGFFGNFGGAFVNARMKAELANIEKAYNERILNNQPDKKQENFRFVFRGRLHNRRKIIAFYEYEKDCCLRMYQPDNNLFFNRLLGSKRCF